MTKNKCRSLIVCIVLIILITLSIWSWLPVAERISLDLIEGDSDKIRIVLITDLHSCYYGKDQNRLIEMVDDQKPDIVILGGDIFDDRLKDDNAKTATNRLAKNYPCYYVSGNHEFWSGRVDEMKSYLKSIGVNVLDGDCKTESINGISLDICGIDDPTYMIDEDWRKQIDTAFSQTHDSNLKILVSHRPERTQEYEKYDFDLILSGHAHAGQFRIPFVNRGIFAPDQGFMAKYINGVYKLANNSTMVVSRGLARESTPLPRFFNHPEIVVIDIE
ncbi:MAG: metallophosphoesterase [Lachnospiraceae bacterium]|nr:metallophosphoesterase [Lachnospiraceae bacterium]